MTITNFQNQDQFIPQIMYSLQNLIKKKKKTLEFDEELLRAYQ